MSELFEKSLSTLEFSKVLKMLADRAAGSHTKEMAMLLRPASTIHECETLQQQTQDAMDMTGRFGSPSFTGLKDVSDALKRAEMGGVLNPCELLTIAALLRCARTTKAYVKERGDGERTSIDGYFSALAGNKYMEDKISQSIISEEEIADNASNELYDIRRKMRQTASKIRDTLSKITSGSTQSKMLQESIITMRSGRYVVPVKAEYRNSFKGLVHDVSASGATVFIEPASVVELNNALKVLESSEKNEIERILAEMSAEVAGFSGSIQRDYDVLCALDLIFARAKLAYDMKAVRPQIIEKGQTRLVKARHPLLDQQKAVPIDFTIGGKTKTVVITGPNTGGKTVSIKTLGLLVLMACSGLMIPAAPGSSVALYKKVFADIGDEQSIQQSLSTFSSHMRTIVDIINEADDRTLVLLDELGAGTDPTEGASLAVSIIKYLRDLGADVAATTHYAELKVFALTTPGVENASCEFDVESLMPTYKLIFGIPGKSNAFAISRKLGIPEAIIEDASAGLGEQDRQMEQVISELEERRQALEKRLAAAESDRAAAEKAAQDASEKLKTVDAEKNKIIESAKKEAYEIIRNARSASEMVMNEAQRIKKQAVSGEDPNVSAAKAAMRGTLNQAETDTRYVQPVAKAVPLPRPLRPGDTVVIAATGTKGTVVECSASQVKLKAGIMTFNVSPDELTLIEDEKVKDKPASSAHFVPGDPKGADRLDIRGMTGIDAELEIDRFIDNALRCHLEEVTIIHGKGTGALRKAVHDHLKAMRQVRSFRIGSYGEGDMGVTVVTLK